GRSDPATGTGGSRRGTPSSASPGHGPSSTSRSARSARLRAAVFALHGSRGSAGSQRTVRPATKRAEPRGGDGGRPGGETRDRALSPFTLPERRAVRFNRLGKRSNVAIEGVALADELPTRATHALAGLLVGEKTFDRCTHRSRVLRRHEQSLLPVLDDVDLAACPRDDHRPAHRERLGDHRHPCVLLHISQRNYHDPGSGVQVPEPAMRQLVMDLHLSVSANTDAAGAPSGPRQDGASDRDLQSDRKSFDRGQKRPVVAGLVADSADQVEFARAGGLPELHVDGLEQKMELFGRHTERDPDLSLDRAVVDDRVDLLVKAEAAKEQPLLRGAESAGDDHELRAPPKGTGGGGEPEAEMVSPREHPTALLRANN